MKSCAIKTAVILVATAVAIPICFRLLLPHVLYHPREYDSVYLKHLERNVKTRYHELRYNTSLSGPQTSYYVPPLALSQQQDSTRGGEYGKERIWLMCSGNAGLTLDWLYFIDASRRANDHTEYKHERGAHFVLFEYPGYGKCLGAPSETSLAESADCALDALASHLNVTRVEMAQRFSMGVVGHSLGAGICADLAQTFADRWDMEEMYNAMGHANSQNIQFYDLFPDTRPPLQVDRVVLLSPFTSVAHMVPKLAELEMLWLTLDHDYNNVRALSLLASHAQFNISAMPASHFLYFEQDYAQAQFNFLIDKLNVSPAATEQIFLATRSPDKWARPARETAPLSIYLFHGTADTLIPASMSRQLFDRLTVLKTENKIKDSQLGVALRELPGVGHNNILSSARYHIWEAMHS